MKNNKRNYQAKIVMYDADYVGTLVYVAKWLKIQANEILTNAKKQNKTHEPVYSKRFTAKLMY